MKTPMSKDGYFLGVGLLFAELDRAGISTLKRARVLLVLAVSPRGFKTRELAKKLGMKPDSLNMMLIPLMEEQMVYREPVVGSGFGEYKYFASLKAMSILSKRAPGEGAEELERLVDSLRK